MLEKAPPYNVNEALLRMQIPGFALKFKEVNNEYLYWDKIKYKKIGNLSPQDIWASSKLIRVINYKQLSFGSYKFNYYPTDSILKSLHQFDMHIGGYMGAKSIVPEENKNRYLVSSIMEEAISSSIMEGAATTEKRRKKC